MSERETDPEAGPKLAELLAGFDEDALVVAMSVIPNLYSRNKMFSLFSDPRLKRARRRAIALRTAVRQLAGGGARDVRVAPSKTAGRLMLTYELPRISYSRRIDVSVAECAVVRFLVARLGGEAIQCADEDRVVVEHTLRRLPIAMGAMTPRPAPRASVSAPAEE